MSQKITKLLGLIALTGLSGLMEAQPFSWVPAGPVYNAGRARNMIVDRNNPQTLYVGSASSGIFKTTNGGVRWYPVNDQSQVRNISYMAQNMDGVIYVGTGEGFLRPTQKLNAQSGTGLYKLDETSGSTPTLVMVASSSVVGTVINRIACHPSNIARIALATNLGIFVSTDGGGSFTQVTLPNVPTGTTVSGQDVKFDANGILYCSIGAEAGTSTLTPSQVYKSTSATDLLTYTRITPTSSFLPDMNYGRIELAIAPSNPNVIYASCSNKYINPSSATLKALFVSYDAGATWGLILQGSAQIDPLASGAVNASGDYAHVITVDRTNPDRIYYGGYRFFTFERTGGSNSNPIGIWAEIGQSFFRSNQSFLHQNIHDIKQVQGTPDIFYFVTDAGIFRSTDLLSGSFPSFQPFYKGLITGQFNSVSIERYPIGEGVGSTTPGTQVTPHSGFIGGTAGNGLTYFSGIDTVVTNELSYLGGEVYNVEYSKILTDAAFATISDGRIFRSANVKNSNPVPPNVNKYVNPLSRIAPEPGPFSNTGVTTGTRYKLWENYGQIANSPDSVVFYNDTVRYQASMEGVAQLTTKTTFTFSTARPNEFALIDSIVIRTGTVQLPLSPPFNNCPVPFTASDRKTIYAKITPTNYTASSTPTVLSSITNGPSSGPLTVTLNPSTLLDNVSVTFSSAPFANKTDTSFKSGSTVVVPDAAVYYRVFATVFYKYQVGDEVSIVDNNITTRTSSYTASIPESVNWQYGSMPSHTITSTSTLAVSNPTYLVTSNALIGNTTQSFSTLPITVTPFSTTNYTIQQYGTFTVNGAPINYSVGIDPETYTLTATINPTLANPVYTLNPGNVTQTTNIFVVAPTTATGTTYTIQSGTGANETVETFTMEPTSFSISPSTDAQPLPSSPNIFIVTPTVLTTYTVSQTTGTLTQNTSSTIGTSTYVLNPGNITQENDFTFTINVTSPTTYTIEGLSSNILSAENTSITSNFPVTNSTVVNFGSVPFAKNNKLVKVPSRESARLALILTNVDITGGQDAIVVSKNPLSLNDPLSFVRISQVGTPIWTDDAAGNPTTNSVTVTGKPTLLEWSHNGTELYYATSTNRLYRVSHITTIMDLSPSSYSGKFYTDIFMYNAPINSSTLNPASPYRTTLIGAFDKPITSISVSNDDSHLAVTFNSSSTGTTATVMYNANDVRTSNQTNINWSSKQGTLPSSVTITYCSLLEKDNDKKMFLGTDNGMYYTTDVTSNSPVWSNVNQGTLKENQLPNVQIMDIKQQRFNHWESYNSGQIYVATNGRGVWTNGFYFKPYSVGIREEQPLVIPGKNLNVFPNPTNGQATLAFTNVDGETAVLNIMDISGRIVKSELIGKLNSGETNYQFETGSLNSGVYLVNVTSDSGVKRITKLIVTK